MASKLGQGCARAELDAIVRQCLGEEASGVQRLQGGLFNAAYRLELASGERFVLRV